MSILRRWFLPSLVYWLYRLLSFSWRNVVIETSETTERMKHRRPLIFAHWHGDELAMVQFVRPFRIATMTSTSSDGSLIDQVILRLGGATSRGSSTRGGIGALKGLVRLLKSGYNASMAVDGPKGPLHQVKPGVFELARLAHADIVPVGIGVSNGFMFTKSWNKAVLPKPFSRVVMVFGPLLKFSDLPKDIRSETLAKQLANALRDAHHQAAKLIAERS